MANYLYVSHGNITGQGGTRTDLDAVSSVAILWRSAILRGLVRGRDFESIFVDYNSSGIDKLRWFKNAQIILADIPPDALARSENPKEISHLEHILRRMNKNNLTVHYVDHHPLRPGTRERFEKYTDRGWLSSLDISPFSLEEDQKLDHTTKRCAAEMVRDFVYSRFGMLPDLEIEQIADYAHDQDYAVRRIPQADRLSVVINANFDPVRLAEFLAEGVFWNEELEEVYQIAIKERAELISQLVTLRREWTLPNGETARVVYALMPPGERLKVTAAGRYCTEQLDCDVSVLVQREAFVSLRLSLTLRAIHAGRMLGHIGGGGHQGAASAGGRGARLPYQTTSPEDFERTVVALDREFLRILETEPA